MQEDVQPPLIFGLIDDAVQPIAEENPIQPAQELENAQNAPP